MSHGSFVCTQLNGWLVVWLVGIYGISAHVDYLRPNPVYAYILDIYDLLRNSSYITFFKSQSSFICTGVTMKY